MVAGHSSWPATGRWAGPGHCSILQDKDGEKLVYHAYDTEWRGVPTLRIAPLRWDSEGWPTIASELAKEAHTAQMHEKKLFVLFCGKD